VSGPDGSSTKSAPLCAARVLGLSWLYEATCEKTVDGGRTNLIKRMFCKMETGYIHIYTGEDWKNLNTAFGMAARAYGAGFSVCFYNFGDDDVFFDTLVQRISISVSQNLENAAQHDMVILYDCDFLDSNTLKGFLACKPQHQEIVLYGTVFDKEILAMANLISKVEAL